MCTKKKRCEKGGEERTLGKIKNNERDREGEKESINVIYSE